MSKKDLPPVPPASRSTKRLGAAQSGEPASERASEIAEPRRRNTGKQGRQGNIAANTRNQGYQQDR